MSAGIRRFKRLLRIREAQENEAAVGLAARLDTLNQVEAQREQLERYLNDYLNALVPEDVNMLKQLARMRDQLREALDQQELRVDAAQAQVDQARAFWLERHQASLSLDKLIERRREQEALQEGRRQQREQDMWATRRAFDQRHQE
ncbi:MULTISPECIES: flagellar export protein FliJ [Marichromatium]|uniref:Flagellar FliJ protein n=1 Tax=Marichromatium gracile TaxID=1048 RepID=A0A4R4A5M2_MARGR|nr:MULTISPECIES: flagellar export protein FliJ [Marichromatium]MBK1708115.1 flagellar export protein FliJ [Marichromatium gracile]RNE89649.1 flagellar export protein FliJ [Marichromatium sp. AB31]RNE94727.1 flagellar export protein FliJ [Marichromatium sp. AB32]TCW33412.1 flagellar FliJ protein [Marichromatium gracile]